MKRLLLTLITAILITSCSNDLEYMCGLEPMNYYSEDHGNCTAYYLEDVIDCLGEGINTEDYIIEYADDLDGGQRWFVLNI